MTTSPCDDKSLCIQGCLKFANDALSDQICTNLHTFPEMWKAAEGRFLAQSLRKKIIFEKMPFKESVLYSYEISL